MTIEQLYLENYHIVYGYLLSLCKNPSLAEELASETFFKALQKINSYDGTCKPSTWLCTIAKNLYFNEKKRTHRHISLTEADHISTSSFEDDVIINEQLRSVLKLAEQLPAESRQVFFMRISGCRCRAIGEALGRSENWARVTFYRTKQTLLTQLKEWED